MNTIVIDTTEGIKLKSFLLILLVVIYPMLFVWQGLDLTDMGYWLSGYQRFFSAPESVNDQLLNWFTYAIGYVVELIGGNKYGVIAHKLGFVVVNWLCLIIAYITLIAVFKRERKTLLLFLMFVTMTYITKSTDNWIGYNNLTSLFYTLGASLLFFGLIRYSFWMMLLAGLVLGLNVFIRFPNLLGLGLVISVWVYGIAQRSTWKVIVLNSGLFIIGYALGIVGMLICIASFGHMEYYINGINSIFTIAVDSSSQHAGSSLLSMFLKDHLRALFLGSVVLATCVMLAVGVKSFSSNFKWSIIIIVSLLAVTILSSREMWKWVFTGCFYIILAVAAYFNYRRDNNKMILVTIAGLVLLFAPLGSSNGIRNAVYGIWLALPLSILLIWDSLELKIHNFHLRQLEFRFFSKLAVTTIMIFSVFTAYGYTYRDSKSRLSMVYSVDYPLLQGSLTTKERAIVVQELLDELVKHVEKGDVILAYNEIPAIHYLTNTKPWLDNPWPLLLSPKIISDLIEERELSGELPVYIIRANGTTSSRDWPNVNPQFDNDYKEHVSRLVFEAFIKKYNYTVIWQNKYFEILRT